LHRNLIRRRLAAYRATNPEEASTLDRVWAFVEAQPRCFERSLVIGHLTGSAWIVSPDRSRALLTHHRKLNQWLQLGGHADGNPDILAVARREAQEESGLQTIYLLSPQIFDIDIHLIPATATEAAHHHYDIRFLFEADPSHSLRVSRESKALAWVYLAEIDRLGVDSSILRMVHKTTKIEAKLQQSK
jgi:8-oxo-dGTP pyrophosphatase MutT (NUDIX family)